MEFQFLAISPKVGSDFPELLSETRLDRSLLEFVLRLKSPHIIKKCFSLIFLVGRNNE